MTVQSKMRSVHGTFTKTPRGGIRDPATFYFLSDMARWGGTISSTNDPRRGIELSGCHYARDADLVPVFDWSWLAHPNTTIQKLSADRAQYKYHCGRACDDKVRLFLFLFRLSYLFIL